MNKLEFEQNLSRIWSESRALTCFSQEDLADSLGVSKKTVQNWEAGDSFPNFKKAVEWFSVLGIPMYPFLMDALYSKEMRSVKKKNNLDDVRKALHALVDELDDMRATELLFCLRGGHGSSPTGTIDLSTMYLSLPLPMRVCIASHVLNDYDLASSLELIDSSQDLPSIETLKRYIDTAKLAVMNGKSSYIFEEERS